MPGPFDTIVEVPENFRMGDSVYSFQGLRHIAHQEENLFCPCVSAASHSIKK